MDLNLNQRFAAIRAIRKAAEEAEDRLRPEVDAAAFDEYYNSPAHPDRQTFAYSGENGFAEVGRLTIKKGKPGWRVDDLDDFNPWALEAGVAVPHLVVYPDCAKEVAEALDKAGLHGAYSLTLSYSKDWEKGVEERNGVPVWKATGEIVPGVAYVPPKLSTMITGCTIAQMVAAERVLGEPIVGTALLLGGAE